MKPSVETAESSTQARQFIYSTWYAREVRLLERETPDLEFVWLVAMKNLTTDGQRLFLVADRGVAVFRPGALEARHFQTQRACRAWIECPRLSEKFRDSIEAVKVQRSSK